MNNSRYYAMKLSFIETVEFIFKPGSIEASAEWLNDQSAKALADWIRSVKKLFLTSSAATLLIGSLWAASQIGAALPIASALTTVITFHALYRATQPLLQQLTALAEAVSKTFAETYLDQTQLHAGEGTLEEVCHQAATYAINKAYAKK
jgi:CBS domain containing-hemolysin-like protein